MVNTNFQTLPEDLQREILLKMPLRSLMNLMCVSKEWAPLIRSKDFRRDYLSLSMTRPRLLFVVHSLLKTQRGKQQVWEYEYETLFQSINPLLPSGQQEVRTDEALIGMVSQPIRGLICIQREYDSTVICNPGSKKCMPLPRILPPQGAHMSCFFGYDQSRDVFKVLAIGIQPRGTILSKQPQIFTVGSDDQSWREITCTHDHVALTEGLFIEGISYYGALSSDHDQPLMIMSFNMTSEDFNAIQWPDQDVNAYRSTLVNYFGKLAIVAKALDGRIYALNAIGIFELWVWEGKWSKTRIEIRGWQETTGPQLFCFLGTIGETTLVFESTPPILLQGRPHSLIYYDTVTGTLRRFEVDIDVYKKKHHTFLNHVDSTWLM